jgi:hypothetical protein
MSAMSERIEKAFNCLQWLPAYGWQRIVRRRSPPRNHSVHLIIALADHFEPAIMPAASGATYAEREEPERRVEEWCREYPKRFEDLRDADGYPFRHTYFYPAEQYEKSHLERLAEHCLNGWGEVEVHLHHGVESPDTAENTRQTLNRFRDALVRHGCLSRWQDEEQPRYAFVHGNWALANSANNNYCGVDEEMRILSETGCYADLTLPSAPHPAQISKINSLYECLLPLDERAPHRRGRALHRGQMPQTFPLIIQGPLGLNFSRSGGSFSLPRIENSALTAAYPPTMHRLRLWREAAIRVEEKPDWIFIKLYCHGMNPVDKEAMLGSLIQGFLKELIADASRGDQYRVHFTTAREMVNIILAACDGLDGNPGDYRDYRLQLITPAKRA